MRVTVEVTAALLIVTAGLSVAATRSDVQGVSYREQGLKVVEGKCLVCHNRQRIDVAIKSKQDMDKVLNQMEKKGVALSDKERMVMGHFWEKSPLKPATK